MPESHPPARLYAVAEDAARVAANHRSCSRTAPLEHPIAIEFRTDDPDDGRVIWVTERPECLLIEMMQRGAFAARVVPREEWHAPVANVLDDQDVTNP